MSQLRMPYSEAIVSVHNLGDILLLQRNQPLKVF
jgi:hypothetical protein